MKQVLLKNEHASVSVEPLNSEFEKITISHRHCEAEISLYGGQVLRFKPTGQQALLWLSDSATYQKEKAIRGGIPLCWPWFGANDKQVEPAGNHGFARQSQWTIDKVSADEQATTIILVLEGEQYHSLWPHAFKVVQTLVFGQSLKQSLAMSNLSTDDAQYSGALHTYFKVSHPSNVVIDTLTGVNFDDKLTGLANTQINRVSCVGPIDREYHSADVMTLVDSDYEHIITITSSGCQQWVLWNPGSELAATMADIHDQGEHEYVCLEAANTHWQTITAGTTVTMSQEIAVQRN
ncbi:D-hexose-6-phosphate mutarotase [Colwellia asteriadis]